MQWLREFRGTGVLVDVLTSNVTATICEKGQLPPQALQW